MAPVPKIFSVAAILMMAGSGLAAPASVDRRQIGGEATAAYGLINNLDNGSGYFLENLEDGIANGMNPGSASDEEYGQYDDGSSAPPAGGAGGPSPKRHVRRQGNKIADGLGPLISNLGQPGIGDAVQNMGDQEDGTLTEGVGDIGTIAGGMEQGIPAEAGYGLGKIAGSIISQVKSGAGGAGGVPAAPRAI